jgi:polyhydroxybutyrate depolymerase
MGRWRLSSLVGFFLLLPGMVLGANFFHTVHQDNFEKRGYWLYWPDRYQGEKSMPLVLALHGDGSDADSLARFSGLNEKADEAGFLVVYPNGTGQREKMLTWNAGRCCGYAQHRNIDDTEFIEKILNEVEKGYPVDRSRIYVTGISNGAMMAYRLVSELPHRIAAVAAVAGSLEVDSFSIKWPVPVMHFHGTQDEFVPYRGGHGPRSTNRVHFTSVQDTIETWAWINEANKVPETVELPDKADDGTRVVRHTYRASKTGADVILYEIQGGGHTWPGRPVSDKILGAATQDISANDLMWEFFKNHRVLK